MSFTQKVNQATEFFQNTKLFRRAQQLKNTLAGIERRMYADKALHNDLRYYQRDLFEQTRENAKKLQAAINKTQIQADSVRGLEQRLSAVIATYQAYQVWHHANGNQQYNAISQWELDKVRAISKEIEKVFTELQKARDSVRSLEKEKSRIQARLDELNVPVTEQLQLQGKIEQMIYDAASTIQSIQNAEKSAYKAADDLYAWARWNGLLLV